MSKHVLKERDNRLPWSNSLWRITEWCLLEGTLRIIQLWPPPLGRDTFHRPGWSNTHPTHPGTPPGTFAASQEALPDGRAGPRLWSVEHPRDRKWMAAGQGCETTAVMLVSNYSQINAVQSLRQHLTLFRAPLAAHAGQLDHASSPQLQLCTAPPPWCSPLNCFGYFSITNFAQHASKLHEDSPSVLQTENLCLFFL